MKQLGKGIVGFAILLIIGLLLWPRQASMDPARHTGEEGYTEAAFCDGAFLGRLAAEDGRKPRLGSARWSREADRRAFVAGYMQGYAQNRGLLVAVQPPEKAAYKSGMEDGAQDRDNGLSFQSARQHILGRDGAASDPTYREAYFTGYQLAYYGDHQVTDALVMWP